MVKLFWTLLIFVVFPSSVEAQTKRRIFDAHVHFGTTDSRVPKMIDFLKENGIEQAVVIFPDWNFSDLPEFRNGKLLPAIGFPCPKGNIPNGTAPCFTDGSEYPPIEKLRTAIEEGKVQVLGEIYTQYFGILPSHESMTPYWKLAEEYDIPVGIHMTLARPGTPYNCCPGFRTEFGDPKVLEDVLVSHPDLRAYIMHAGWPFAESTIALLYVYPQLYLDLSGLQNAIPRNEYHSYLKRLVELGFESRIMWGSDGPILDAIEAIEEAEYLSDEQKDAIFYDNAAKFFRLKE